MVVTEPPEPSIEVLKAQEETLKNYTLVKGSGGGMKLVPRKKEDHKATSL